MSEKIETKPKKKGPIRFEAIIPVTIISSITFVYFSYYFDRHLKSLVEYVGTQGNGAEVNVSSINISFIKGKFELNQLQVTDKENPAQNSLEIGNIHFKFIWDALLRMKFVVEDASINNIQINKPRKSPGKVLPPGPARPSKINEIQNEVIAQVKNKYSANMLGDVLSVLEGTDFKDQINQIRETLKSEARVQEMVSETKSKKDFWDKKVKELSDPSKIKAIETQVQSIAKEKNVLKQAQGIKTLGDLLKDVEKQYKEVQNSSKQLQSELKAVSQYPAELQKLVNDDIASLKNRFSVPQLDFKDMAMHLFAGEFAEHLAKARKYQALAKQYIPEKKEEEEILPPKRSEGKNYDFPITAGYPLFWLKRAAISSQGTANSFSGNVSGELTNVTTDPKYIQKPAVLDLRGDFPTAQIMGVKALITLDHTREISKQSALLQVNQFPVPEKMFVSNEKLQFGFLSAIGAATFKASISDGNIEMNWNSVLNRPNFKVETNNKIAKEILNNVVNGISQIDVNGTARGTFTNLSMEISSNLGDELANGFSREIGAKLTEAQNKLNALVEEKINKPKAELMSQLQGNNLNLSNLNNLQELYKKNEGRIKEEIEKIKKGGTSDLKEKGKKLLKGFKL